MSATNRVEKHKGITLVVRDDWMALVFDATGHSFEGPATDDPTVRRISHIVIPVLQFIGKFLV